MNVHTKHMLEQINCLLLGFDPMRLLSNHINREENKSSHRKQNAEQGWPGREGRNEMSLDTWEKSYTQAGSVLAQETFFQGGLTRSLEFGDTSTHDYVCVCVCDHGSAEATSGSFVPCGGGGVVLANYELSLSLSLSLSLPLSLCLSPPRLLSFLYIFPPPPFSSIFSPLLSVIDLQRNASFSPL